MNVSVKGARNNNEDAIYADGQMFAVYDGHGGNQCAEYLKEHLHNNIIMQPEVPSNVHSAINKGCRLTDQNYVNKMYAEF